MRYCYEKKYTAPVLYKKVYEPNSRLWSWLVRENEFPKKMRVL